MALPGFQDMLTTLVGTPSVSCTCADIDQSNLAVIEHLANWLDDLGFEVELLPLPDSPGKANLVATFAGRAGKRAASNQGGLALAGHTDTVPYDEGHWRYDPLALTDVDNRFYGLGACDMKGFFPLALGVVERYLDATFTAPITVIATSDEESSMAGARYLVQRDRPRARYAIIGEPTGLMPVYAHKGIAMLAIRLQGSSGHSSNPELGTNALDAMHSVMGELIAFRTELAGAHSNPGFAVPVPTLNLGCLHAGDNPNRICDHAELQIDLRLLPGMVTDSVIAELGARLHAVGARHGTPVTIEPLYPPVPPFESPADGDLAATLARESGRAPGTVAFGTEGPFMQSLGMETVVFGAGSIDQAHQPDEFLAHDQIEPARRALAAAIERYCIA